MSDDIFDAAERMKTAGNIRPSPEARRKEAQPSVSEQIAAQRARIAGVKERQTLKAVRSQANREEFKERHPVLTGAGRVVHSGVSRLGKAVSGFGGAPKQAQRQVVSRTTQQQGRPQPTFAQRDAPGLFSDVGARGGLFDRPKGNDIFGRSGQGLFDRRPRR